MAVIGTATLNIVPKVQGGLANAINGEISKANVAGMGKSAASSFMGGFASGASIGAWSAVASKAIGAVSSSLDSAVSRVDTLNNYPRIMESLGVSSDVASASMSKMSTSLDNVPTRLDDMANTVQGIYAATMRYGTGLDTVTDAGLALNSMLLAGGQSTGVVNAAMEQFRQMVAKGKPDMQDWRSLISAAPGQMDQLAKSVLGAGASVEDLYAVLGGGKEGDYAGPFEWGSMSMGEFVERFAELRGEFESAATDAQGGIGTSFANMRNAVTKGVANVLDAFGRERIAGAIGDVKGLINDAFGRTDADGLRAFAVEVAPMFSDAWESMMGRVSDFSDRVGPSVSRVADTLIRVAADAGPSVGNAFGSILDAAADAAPSVADALGDIAEVAGDTISGIADIIADAAPVVSAIAQDVLPVVGDVAQAIGPALPAIIVAKTAFGGLAGVAGGLSSAGGAIQTVAGALGAFGSVLPMVGGLADVGPALSLIAESGKLMGASGIVGSLGGLATAAAEVLPMVGGLSDIPAALSLIAESGGGLAAAFNPATLAIGAAAASAGLLGVGVMKVTENERRARRASSDLNEALSLMRGNTEGLGAAMFAGSGDVRGYGDAAKGAGISLDELADSIERHNQRNARTREGAAETVAMLGQYRDIVDECAGAGEVSASKQAELEWALQGIKDATGEAFSVEQVLTGEYQNQAGEVMSTKDAIDQLIASKQQEARVNALQDMYTDALKEQMKADQAHQEISEKYHKQHDRFVADQTEAMKRQGMAAEEAAKHAEERFRNGQYGYLAEEYEASAKALEGLTKETQTYADMMGEAVEAERKWGDREGIIMTTERMREACEEYGISAKSLAEGMEAAGISTEQFAAIGGDQFAMMAEMAGGDMDTLIGLINDYNATEFQSKYGDLHVDGYGQVVDAVGTIYEWNGTEFVPKYLHVEDDGSIQKVEDLNSELSSVPDANATMTATTSGQSEVDSLTGRLNEYNGFAANSTYTNTSYGYAEATALGSYIKGMDGFTATSTYINRTINETITKSGNGHTATGGHIEPHHAAGFIAAKATRTNWGIVGEDGIEAVYNNDDGSSDVYPLNNPRYLGYADPLAQRIADAVLRNGSMGGTTNVYIDNARINGDAEIQTAFISLFDTLVRKGAMNVG